MKTVMINRNSWHFWLAHVWDVFVGNWGSAEDFCQYTRRVAGGFLVVVLGGAVGCVIAGAVVWSAGDFLGWLVAGIIYGFVAPWVAATFLGGLAAVVIFFGCRVLRPTVLLVADHQPAFLRDAYTSLKDRVCYRVEVR